MPYNRFVNGYLVRRLFVAFLLVLAEASWAQETDGRPILAVLDFTVSGVSAGDAGLFGDMLTSHIVRSGNYRVIGRRDRDAILQEIESSVSDCSDESCQFQVGRLLAASRIVVGSIGVLGNLFLVSLRLLAVETGEALAGVSEKYRTVEAEESGWAGRHGAERAGRAHHGVELPA